MSKINLNEISSLIKEQIKAYKEEIKTEVVGTVVEVGDGIAQVYGLDNAMQGELISFPNDVFGTVLDLSQSSVGVILFGDSSLIKEGDTAKCTGRILSIPVGEGFLGRVIDPLGNPLDGKGAIISSSFRPIDVKASGVMQRQSVKQPLQTGIKCPCSYWKRTT